MGITRFEDFPRTRRHGLALGSSELTLYKVYFVLQVMSTLLWLSPFSIECGIAWHRRLPLSRLLHTLNVPLLQRMLSCMLHSALES